MLAVASSSDDLARSEGQRVGQVVADRIDRRTASGVFDRGDRLRRTGIEVVALGAVQEAPSTSGRRFRTPARTGAGRAPPQ